MESTDDEGRWVVARGGRAGVLGTHIHVGPHRLLADEPIADGGGDRGPRPSDYLLAGLGACTAITLRMYADRKGWPLEQVEVSLRHAGEAAAGQREAFIREVHLIGELSDDERARLLQIAERCPVSRTLSAGVDIRTALATDPAAGEATS